MAEVEENFGEPDMDQLPEDSEPEQKRGHDDDSSIGGVEKRWPGWPGESVFRMLVPAQKVGSIIGRKGEFIKKIVEETRARIKILDGPPGTAERAVSFFSLLLLSYGCTGRVVLFNYTCRWLLGDHYAVSFCTSDCCFTKCFLGSSFVSLDHERLNFIWN